MKFLTKNQVINQLKTLANNHWQVRGFGYGDRWELETTMTKSDSSEKGLSEPEKQPFLWVTPIIARVSDGSLFYDFEIIIGDLVKKDESSELDVESDTLLICLDILSKLDDQSYDWALDKQSNLQPFTEKWDSEFTGHTMNISLEFMFNYDYCQAPLLTQDEDFTNFLAATGIDDKDQVFALNYLITELKANNLWDKMHVIYPFVGGTAQRHSFNLRNPSQNQIDWYGGVTHDETGITGDGIDGYGDTNYVIPPENQDSLHLSVYHRNDIDTGVALGITSISTSSLIIPSSTNIFAGRINQYNGGEISNPYTQSSNSYFLSSRLNSTTVKNFKNNTLLYNESSTSSLPESIYLFILCRNLNNIPNYYSQSNISLITIGEGVTDDEVNSLNIIVTEFQTYLKRQIIL